jgi:hypothetical protein
MDVKIRVCLPRKYERFMLPIDNNFLLSGAWACTLFRNNKQHVVLGKKRVATRGRKRTLTDSEKDE